MSGGGSSQKLVGGDIDVFRENNQRCQRSAVATTVNAGTVLHRLQWMQNWRVEPREPQMLLSTILGTPTDWHHLVEACAVLESARTT